MIFKYRCFSNGHSLDLATSKKVKDSDPDPNPDPDPGTNLLLYF